MRIEIIEDHTDHLRLRVSLIDELLPPMGVCRSTRAAHQAVTCAWKRCPPAIAAPPAEDLLDGCVISELLMELSHSGSRL